MTGPQLLAEALGLNPKRGGLPCFFCGGGGATVPISDVLLDTFSALSSVRARGSKVACVGCQWAMATHEEGFVDAGGELRTGRAAQPRLYSWIVTAIEARAHTKAHLDLLRAACLNPPIPCAICLSDSGQKHLLYLTPVATERFYPTVTLEGRSITYRVKDLGYALDIAIKIAAACGKPGLDSPNFSALLERYGVADAEALLLCWGRLRTTPLGELAAWLAPSKESANATLDSRHGDVPA